MGSPLPKVHWGSIHPTKKSFVGVTRMKKDKNMPVYKDKERDTWFCKFNYKDWRGETKTKLKRGFRTKKEAQEWEREFLHVQQADMDMEFGKVVNVYFVDKANRLKERTVETKKTMIDTKIIPYFGKCRMNTIKPADIMKW